MKRALLVAAAAIAMASACTGGRMLPSGPGGSNDARALPLHTGPYAKQSTCAKLVYSTSFNGTSIPAGSTIWLTLVFNAGTSGNDTESATGVTATIQSGTKSYTVKFPDGYMAYNQPLTTSYVNYVNGTWNGVSGGTPGYPHFLTGAAFKVPAGGIVANAKFTATGTFSTTGGSRLDWIWGAAVYSQFQTDYTQLGVKANGNPNYTVYHDTYPAGTPETQTSYLMTGGTGNGAPDFTGGYFQKETSVTMCAGGSTPPPAPAAAMYSMNEGAALGSHSGVGGQIVSYYPGHMMPPADAQTELPGFTNSATGGMDVDSSGNLWVAAFANAGSSTQAHGLYEYAAYSTSTSTPIFSLAGSSSRLYAPSAVAVDSSGKVYVGDQAHGASAYSIEVYAPQVSGGVAFSRRITSPVFSIYDPSGFQGFEKLGFDHNGNLWVGGDINGNHEVFYKFKATAGANASPLATIDTTSLGYCRGFVFDATGNLHVGCWVNSYNTVDTIYTFPPGFTAASQFTSKLVVPTAKYTTSQLADIGMDLAGNVYETNYTETGGDKGTADFHVWIFAPGKAKPIVDIHGPNAGFNEARKLAIYPNPYTGPAPGARPRLHAASRGAPRKGGPT